MSANVEGYRNESFDSLEAAVLETQRGRWFLEEYAKRQRSAETLAILDILRKLENTITNPGALPEAKQAEKVSTEQLKFFKRDEEIFVEPTLATPALAVVPAAPAPLPPPIPQAELKPAVESKGAKLKIQRLAPQAQPEEPPVAEAPQPETPVPAAIVRPEPAAAPEPKSRVIIIRKPASEVSEIPMLDEKAPEVAA